MSNRSFLFFDLDRTLWDFERNSLETLKGLFVDFELRRHGAASFGAFNAVYQEENAKCWADYQRGTMTKQVLRGERFRRTLRLLGMDEAISEGLGQQYVARGPHQRHLLDGALDVLSELQGRGYPLHILTNGFKEVQHIKVDNSGIGQYIDAVWTSDELGHLKPALACFEGALKGVGATPDQAWMIGDDHAADVVGAHQAGWKSIHFAPSGDTPASSPATASVAGLKDLLALLP